MVRYVVLDQEAFREENMKAFKPVPLSTELEKERFPDEVFRVQGAVVEALTAEVEGNDRLRGGLGF